MSSSTVCRRLHGLFKSPNTTTTTFLNRTPKSTTTSTTSSAVAVDTPLSSETSLKERYLRQIVIKCKKFTESNGRRNHRIDEKAVRRLAAAGKFQYIKEIIEHQKKHDDTTSEGFNVHLISLYGKAGMFEDARKLFDEMPQLNCERTLVSLNALLSAGVNSKKYDDVQGLFRELPEKLSMKPDIFSYNILLKSYCDMGSFDLAFSVINEMEENGLEPDIVTFNTILGSLCHDGKLDDAEKAWTMMEDKNVVPNVRSYNHKLRALVEDDRVSEAIQLFQEMGSKDIKPDISSFNSLIKGFWKEGNLEEAKRVYKEIVEAGCSPSWVTFYMLLRLACDKNDFDFGREICKEAIARSCYVKKPMMLMVIDGLIKESKTEEADELVQFAKSHNFNVDKEELVSV